MTISLRRTALLAALTGVAIAAVLIFSDNRAPESLFTEEGVAKFAIPKFRSSFSPKSHGDDAQARYEYELMRVRDPQTGRIPPDIRSKELAFVKDLPRAEVIAAKTGRAVAEQWSFRGPTNVGGRTRALAVDLDYNGTSNRRLLAGGISGGMYLSEDDGATWTLRTSLADVASVTTLAQDPNNRNVWYHGTGELVANSAGGGAGGFFGQGMFKSTDFGRTWTQLLSTRQGKPNTRFDSDWDFVWKVIVHPNGSRVYAATIRGVSRSTDGGSSWQKVLDAPASAFTDIVVASDGDLYAAVGRNGSGATPYGVFKSTSLGDQWQDISPPGLVNDPWRMVLAEAASDAEILYLLVQTNQQGATANDHQLFKYTDATGTWSDLGGALPNEQGATGNASFSTQGGYDQLVQVKPDDANTVFIGGTNLYRSTDGGASFVRIGGYSSPANYNQFANHHSDQHALAFLPTNASVALSGSDGGVSKSNNIMAQPHSWTSLNNGYVTTQFYTVAIDPQAGGPSIVGGLQDNGTWLTQAAEGASAWIELVGGDGAYAAIVPGGNTMYTSVQNGTAFRLTSSGGFAGVTPAGGEQFVFVNPFVLDPNDFRVMYMGGNGGVWRNSNLDDIPNGDHRPTSVNWTFLDSSARQGFRTTTVAAAKTPPNRVYFGVTNFQSSAALIRLDDAHTNGPGTDITPPVSAQFAPYPNFIAVNPDNGDEVIAVFSNYNLVSLWHSTDAGANWTNIEGNLAGENGPSMRSAAIVPTNSGKLFFIATSTGVYSTASLAGSATTWALEGGGVLGNVVVDMLAARPDDGTVVAATHGRGVYQAKIGQGGAAAVATLDVTELNIAVQPGAMGSTSFTLTNTGTASLSFNIGAVGKTQSVASKHVLQLRPDTPGVRKRPRLFKRPTADLQPERAPAGTAGQSVAAISSGDFIVLDDGSDLPDDFLGWGDGITPFQWGSHFFAPVGGFTLESFFVYMRSESLSSLPISAFITDPQGNVFVSGSVDLPASASGTWYQITFNPIPLPEGQAFDIEIVAPEDVLFPAGVDANGLVPGAGFYWVNTGLDGFYADLASTSGFENGAWLLRAEGTAGGGSLNQPPIARIQASKTQVVINESITFDGSTSRDPDGSITQYAWAFGDGGTSTQQIAQHAYTQSGSYTATLTVTDNEGATGQASVPITVASDNMPPVAVIQVSKNQAEVNEEITFDGSGSTDPDGSIAQYAWAFGDGGTASQPVATHAYTGAGAYTATLTVTDNEGGTASASAQINILTGPSRLSVSPLSGTLGPGESQVVTVTYDATTQGAGTYSGQVSLNSNGGNVNLPVTITVDPAVEVEDDGGVPDRLTLDQNYPNPFNPETTIQFTLERPSNVRLAVFDVNGRTVRTLLEGDKASGAHRVTWDGRDSGGRPVASGTYLYRIEAAPVSGEAATHFSRKMILVR